MSFHTMTVAVSELKKAVTFEVKIFDLTKHWQLHIDAVLQDLLNEGMLTREQKLSREPAGAFVFVVS